MMASTSGCCSRMRPSNSMPSPSGSRRSMMATSGTASFRSLSPSWNEGAVSTSYPQLLMRSAVLTRVNISSSMIMIFCAILATFRELEGEYTSFALGALKLHASTVVFSDHLDDGQAYTAAAVLRGVVEAEDFRLFTLFDALPSILHRQDTLPVMLSASQGQGAAAGHGVKGIDGEI